LTGLAIGIPAGLIIGYFAGSAHWFDSEAASAPAAVVNPAPIPAAAGQLAAQQRILTTEAALANDPKNVQGWVQLGNDYFDLHMNQKAVDAYGKALALAPTMPSAPSVLTDQGVMYRELKDFDKAIANFKLANKLDPTHTQSLFNLGIVYAQDKNDKVQAEKAFTRVIEIAPNAPTAEQARKAIAELKAPAVKP
jgi:cytochrome c-type biogenesis protein CcmH/NrfG